ncbi:PKD domain-containing protein [Sphingobacteriales bacterium UPWRP_1]|nr:hypothetical protein BVG80_11945 [Sphingobacteriales bacterium TSM_CSM]PSJ77934.1 PKD domain-containing protein [Sphingobacteriales bacterium UPWRP_1]
MPAKLSLIHLNLCAMKTFLLHICLMLLISTLLEAQPKYFSKIYDNGVFQDFMSVKLNNENFIILGNFTTFATPWSIMLFNMDNYCDSIWKREIVLTEGEIVSGDFIITTGGYAMVGNKTLSWEDNQTTAYQAHVTTTDMQGTLLDIIPLSNLPSTALGITKTQDGGYLIVGSIVPDYPNNPPYNTEMYAVKLNDQFDIEWERIYNDLGYYYDNYLTDILPAPDGSGYYLLGTVNFYFNTIAWVTHGQIAILHINNTGEVIEQFILDPPGNVAMQSTKFIPTQDGGFLLAPAGVATDEMDYIGVYVKLTNDFDIEWMSYASVNPYMLRYGGCGSAVSLPDGSFVVGGCLGSTANQWYDAQITKLDANGNPLWSRRYGGSYSDYCYDMIATPDGGYLMVGRQDTLTGAFAYIVKTNCMGLLTEPQAAFTFATDSTTLAATFYNQSQYVYPDSIDGGHFIWQFDDGTPPYQTKEPTPITHLYSQPGTYYVTLQAIVCNDTGTYTTIVKPQSGWGTAVGIPENSPEYSGSGVVVYPNPAQNTLHFSISNPLVEPFNPLVEPVNPLVEPVETSISLYTPAGQLALQTPFVSTSSTTAAGSTNASSATHTISVAHLPAGIYFYVVSGIVGGDSDNGYNGGISGDMVLARGKVAVVR